LGFVQISFLLDIKHSSDLSQQIEFPQFMIVVNAILTHSQFFCCWFYFPVFLPGEKGEGLVKLRFLHHNKYLTERMDDIFL